MHRDGYFVCNVGAWTDADLSYVASGLSSPECILQAGHVVQIKRLVETSYLTLTRSRIPFHNDGAFRAVPPRYLVLYCEEPGCRGGETLIARGDHVLARLELPMRSMLERTHFRTRLGGLSAVRSLVVKHPRDGTAVVFFGDPAISPECTISAGGEVRVRCVVGALRRVLRDPLVVRYRHSWRRHDLLILDNYKVLHARTAYRGNRLLKRMEIFPRTTDAQ